MGTKNDFFGFKKCNKCGEIKWYEEFPNKSHRCISCGVFSNVKRQTLVKLLPPYGVSKKELDSVMETFGNKCCVTGSKDIHIEHFIPINWGHGGTFKGNLYLLDKKMNLKKSTKNPFEWMEELNNEEKEKFKTLAKMLAKENNMTYEEFQRYVNWCEKNQRSTEQIIMDNERGLTSIDLWKQSLTN